MLARQQVPRIEHIAVLVAGVLVSIYAGWVIRHVGASSVAEAPPSRPAATSASATYSFVRARRVTGQGAQSRCPDGGPAHHRGGEGDELGEWVDLWAQYLGRARQVVVHSWPGADGGRLHLTSANYGYGRPLNIWNLSSPDAEVDYTRRLAQVPVKPGGFPAEHRPRSWPERPQPRCATGRGGCHKPLGRVPTAWVLQNPTTVRSMALEAVVGQMQSLAARKRVPVIDAHAAFAGLWVAASIAGGGAFA